MTINSFSVDAECPILKAARKALDEIAREDQSASPRLKATFVSAKLKAFAKPEFNLASALLDRIFEEPKPKCSECGREK